MRQVRSEGTVLWTGEQAQEALIVSRSLHDCAGILDALEVSLRGTGATVPNRLITIRHALYEYAAQTLADARDGSGDQDLGLGCGMLFDDKAGDDA